MIRLSNIIGHLLLVAAITLDYHRRESPGSYRLMFLLPGAVVLLVVAVFFSRDPRAFCFGHHRQSTHATVELSRDRG
jgi:hypothetical protein